MYLTPKSPSAKKRLLLKHCVSGKEKEQRTMPRRARVSSGVSLCTHLSNVRAKAQR